jgi:hypothetical protein
MAHQADELLFDLQLFGDEDGDTTTDTQTENEETSSETESNEETHEEEEFDEVVFNHETIKVPKSRRKDLIQKGLNHDRVKERAEKAHEALTKAAKVQGFDTVESYLEAVERAEQEAQMERYQQAGITDPGIIQEMINKHPVVQQATRQQRAIEIITQKEALKDQPFFKDLEADIDALMSKTPGVDVRTAYIFLRGEKFDELAAKKASQTTEEALKNHNRQAKRGVESSDDPPNNSSKKLDFSPDEREWAERRVRQGHYKDLAEAHKALRSNK